MLPPRHRCCTVRATLTLRLRRPRQGGSSSLCEARPARPKTRLLAPSPPLLLLPRRCLRPCMLLSRLCTTSTSRGRTRPIRPITRERAPLPPLLLRRPRTLPPRLCTVSRLLWYYHWAVTWRMRTLTKQWNHARQDDMSRRRGSRPVRPLAPTWPPPSRRLCLRRWIPIRMTQWSSAGRDEVSRRRGADRGRMRMGRRRRCALGRRRRAWLPRWPSTCYRARFARSAPVCSPRLAVTRLAAFRVGTSLAAVASPRTLAGTRAAHSAASLRKRRRSARCTPRPR
mmetsp:Transcript_38657/g.95615  ORF Transcript_38657/g.95615 Transcript_38657/m.95615 type:complete len:283 (-) Transcript_38657:389-1237(-)